MTTEFDYRQRISQYSSTQLIDLWEQIQTKETLEILGAKYRSTAISIAGTLMSDRSRPVLLVVDAKSTKPEDIREETQTVEYLLLRCATAEPYKVISAVPSIAALIQEIATSPDPKHHPLLQQINQFLTESLLPVA
jgi:hypothetical protein